MFDLQRTISRIDRFQQRHGRLAFAYSVVKKFGDDGCGNLASLITYYGFVCLFPLLLVATTVLGYVLHDNPDLQRRILDSALANYPIIGDQIRTNVTTVRGTGAALFIGILVTLYGGLGIANVAQDAMNRIWGVPVYARPGFFPRLTRSVILVAMLGLAILATTILSAVAARLAPDLRTNIGVTLAAIACNIVLFAVAFQVTIGRHVAWRALFPGAIAAGVAWEALQRLGAFYISRVLEGMSHVYGVFALVLGLLVWISLQARVVLYAAEINAVRADTLWPRSIAPPLTDADRRADLLYPRIAQRRHNEPLERPPP